MIKQIVKKSHFLIFEWKEHILKVISPMKNTKIEEYLF